MTDHTERQQAFYARGEHAHLRPQGDDAYADKIVGAVVQAADIRDTDRVLEVGAGFGRFTFSLLERCQSVIALDLSARALEELDAERTQRGIAQERCCTLCKNVDEVEAHDLVGPIDAVVGIFFLHHLPDVERSLARLATLLGDSGRMGFVEPNRLNPLYAVQILACPDMTWQEEKGLYRIDAARIASAFRAAGLEPTPGENFGFFPPSLHNASAPARRVEAWIERIGPLRWALPFIVSSARRA